MLSYNGVTYTWEHGRELATMSDSTGTWTFTYDANGMRTKKVKTNTSGAATDTYTYVYNGSQLSQMKKNSNVLNFFYDGEGRPAYFTYNNTTYYYVTNLQGDVIAILDSTGAMVVNYHYDAYGALVEIDGPSGASLGVMNPLTYRGYVYDHDTGLYYLQSRYYNPTVRQFISPDAFVSTGQGYLGYNMFAYCGNNPVNRIDPTGEAWWHWALGAVVVAACAVATVATCGGFAAAATAVCMVGNGVAAATTASTVAAAAFIGSATVYGGSVLVAASSSNSIEEFYAQGNWGTVGATAFGGLMGGYDGFTMSKVQAAQTVADDELFLPDSFYSKHAPKQSTPNSSYTNYTYNNYTGEYEKSTAYYDFAGRQVIRIDWTNHGYSNHGNPHVHYTTYNSQYRDGYTIRWD